ncbi:nephrocystin-4-like, partial [Silurus meridionalis]
SAMREPQLAQPARFSGDPDSCRSFIMQCDLIFSMQPSQFGTERSKVAYVISLLSGRALRWATAEWESRSPNCGSFAGFSAELRKVFGTSTPRQDAARSLVSAAQGQRSVAEYAAEFRTQATDSGWDRIALYDTFLQGLSSAVKDELAARDPPRDLDSLISLATRIDRRIRERRRERGYPTQSLGPHSPLTASGSPPRVSGSGTRSFSPPQAMEIGRHHLTPAEKEKRRSLGLCLYCGGKGHMAASCPVKGKAR